MLLTTLLLLSALVLLSHLLLVALRLKPALHVVLCALAGALLLQGANRLRIGYTDPFFPIALAVSLPPALLVAWLLHWAHRRWRARR